MILILGGRRSGKTTGTLAPKILGLLIVFVAKPGCVLSPTYRQSMNVWRALNRHTPSEWWAERNKSERRMKLVTGSEVVLLSADRDDSSRSEGCAWQVNDERQDISEEAAANAELSASEATGIGAHMIIETATIKPELREHFEKVEKSAKGAVYYMASFGNPFIDHSFLYDAMEFLDEERVLREIHARWPDLVGRCYHPYSDTDHVRDSLALRDITSALCMDRFDLGAEWIASIDPPGHAVLWKVLDGDVAHVRHEVVIGADGSSGDVKDLARRCREFCRDAPAIAISDPHESGYDDDVRKYFRNERFRIVHMKQVQVEYRLTAVRSRLQKGKLYVASNCVHLRESLKDQLYDPTTHKPDKKTPSRITPTWTLDHIVDALGYGVYKLWPAKVDYERLERETKRAA